MTPSRQPNAPGVTTQELVRATADLADRFGPERAAVFGAGLPGLVADLSARWEVSVERLYPSGATSVVLAVQDPSGAPAVMKLSPDAPFLDRQVGMLRHLGPTGRVPGVLRQDAAAGAVLLERVEPGDTLDSLRATPPTARQWADLLANLHGTPTDGVPDRLSDRCEDMFQRIGARQRQPAVREQVPDVLWEASVAECRELLRTGGELRSGGELLRTDGEQVTIHGDLHLGNVLAAGDRGLVVIDPKLCVGDRCFDMVDFVATSGTPEEMTARAAELAPLVDMDLDRLLRWSRVNAVVTAISRLTWHSADERSAALLEFGAP